MLEQFRAEAGAPVQVDDAYRCPVHNAQVGGVKDSQHGLGNAADVKIAGMTGAQLEAIARRCPLVKGIGRSDFADYIHLDVGPPREWCYSRTGAQEAYYPPA